MIIGNDLEVIDFTGELPEEGLGYAPRDASAVQEIIMHHTAGAFHSMDEGDETALLRRLHQQHIDQGWPGLAYPLMVFPSGRIYLCGDLNTVRYHCAGPDDPDTPLVVSRFNERGLAICLAGNFSQTYPNPVLLEAARRTVANVQFAYGSFLPVVGHRDRFATQCPGDTWDTWKDAVVVLPPTPEEVQASGPNLQVVRDCLELPLRVADLLDGFESPLAGQLRASVGGIRSELGL